MSEARTSSLSSSFAIWMLLQFNFCPNKFISQFKKIFVNSLEIATEANEKYM